MNDTTVQPHTFAELDCKRWREIDPETGGHIGRDHIAEVSQIVYVDSQSMEFNGIWWTRVRMSNATSGLAPTECLSPLKFLKAVSE